MWLHLTSGRAAIHGFVIGTDGSPHCGGPAQRTLPVAMGGTMLLFEGLDPMRNSPNPGPVFDLRHEPPAFDSHGFDWAGRTTTDMYAKAASYGWRMLTRRQAAELLVALGYAIPPRRAPDGAAHFHSVLWDDQIDGLTWHVRESWEGFRFVYGRSVFVYRELELSADSALARGASYYGSPSGAI